MEMETRITGAGEREIVVPVGVWDANDAGVAGEYMREARAQSAVYGCRVAIVLPDGTRMDGVRADGSRWF